MNRPRVSIHRPRRAPQPHLLAIAPEWLTRQQAADIAGVTPKTIDRWRILTYLITYTPGSGRAYRPVLVSRDCLAQIMGVTGPGQESP
jgi:hypothetical protein